jgi:hypothetical protein
MIYENGSTNLTWNQSNKTVTFSGNYTDIPVVNATLYNSNVNLNITIQNITTIGFTILLSDNPGTTITVNYIVFGE